MLPAAKICQSRVAASAAEAWSLCSSYLPKTASPEPAQAPQLIIICSILPSPSFALAWAPSPLITEVAIFCLHSWQLSNCLYVTVKVTKSFDPLTEIPVVASGPSYTMHCCRRSLQDAEGTAFWRHYKAAFLEKATVCQYCRLVISCP